MLSSHRLSPDCFHLIAEEAGVTGRTSPFYMFKRNYSTYLGTAATIAFYNEADSDLRGVPAFTLSFPKGNLHILRRVQTEPLHKMLDIVVVENTAHPSYVTFSGSSVACNLEHGLQGFTLPTKIGPEQAKENWHRLADQLCAVFNPWESYLSRTLRDVPQDSDRLDYFVGKMAPIAEPERFWEQKVAPYFEEVRLVNPFLPAPQKEAAPGNGLEAH